MSFVAPIGAAITKGGLSLGSILGLGGAAVGAVAETRANRFRSSIAMRNAELLRQNAEDTRQAGQANQQERDMEAAAIMSDIVARNARSGFSVSSTSFVRRNRAAQVLARRDALRIRADADREAVSLENQAEGEVVTAQNFRRAGRNSILSGLFDFTTGLVDGASLVNRRTALRLNRQARDMSAGNV